MTRLYLIDPTNDRSATHGLLPGEHFFEARLVRNGPLVAVRTQVLADRPELDVEDTHIVEIAGERLPFREWHNKALIGEEITEAQYRYRLAAAAWDKAALGMTEYKPVDVMELPVAAFAPPVKLPQAAGYTAGLDLAYDSNDIEIEE